MHMHLIAYSKKKKGSCIYNQQNKTIFLKLIFFEKFHRKENKDKKTEGSYYCFAHTVGSRKCPMWFLLG